MRVSAEVEGRDAEYFEEHIGRGGIFVSVDTRLAKVTAESAQIILERCGGHSANEAQRRIADSTSASC